MGSIQECYECPKCKTLNFCRDYYYKTDEEYCICMNCGYSYNRYYGCDENGHSKMIIEEDGGFGIVTIRTESGILTSTALEEGVIPEITDDVVFASAIVDGKLTILKDGLERKKTI